MNAARANGPIVCVSYLALAELWRVPQFPAANHGAAVTDVELSIAADAPMAAAVLSALDVPTLLITNHIGEDEDGRTVQRWLRQHGVNAAGIGSTGVVTPWIAVVADDHHTRTWFAHLPGVVDGLNSVDLSAVTGASFVYVDAYELIEVAAVRVITVARAAGVPLLINLGGSPLSDGIRSAVAGYEKLLVQTNVSDAEHDDVPFQASSLLAQTGASWVIVTAGAFGAVAVSRIETVSVPAFPVTVRHTHCAGAAFSGGLLYGLREGWSMEQSMVLGSASGALRCARHYSAPLPTLAELEAVITSAGWAEAS
ncbi:carbohydrate kinase family protein [Nocardia cyriacigeorgica]|uniref:carbohydrate kinase family protein n=1 Tax=Nocardia cyriacigeorgica TaxID=135487 RepID=UPI0024579778|nr:carbohydrate kinase family protein [Nocardia cyriacigeorgica]